MNTKTPITPQIVCDEMSVGELVNTVESPFWYCKQGDDKFSMRYPHETGAAGDTFYDGNNGDRWKVVAINREFKRIIVENLTQHGTKLAFWN